MSNNNIDRREHPRFSVGKAIYIEVVKRGNRSEANSNIVRCETLDVSAGGLRVAVPIPIAQGSVLNIAVPMDDWKENLELVGEAMWVKQADDKKCYWVGLALKDSSREDMERWCRVVHELRDRS